MKISTLNIQLSLEEICDFFMQNSDIVYVHSNEGIITYAKKGIENSIGYTAEEVTGKHFTCFIHPDDIKNAVDVFEKSRLKTSIEGFHLRLRHKNGDYLHFDFKAHSIFKNGDYIGAIGAGQDITAKIKKEEAFGESIEIYKILVKNARDVIYTVSPEGIVTSVNDFVKNITGFDAEEIIGKNYLYFIHPEEIEYGIKIHEAIKRGEKPAAFEMRFLKKSGDYLLAEFSITPFFHNGKFLGTLGIGRDISEKKKNEESLKNALVKERQLNDLKQHFISMVSHEFRTPLFLINGTIEMLEIKCKNIDDEKTSRSFKTIKENVNRISTILNDIILLCDDKNECIFNPGHINIITLCSDIIKDVNRSFNVHDKIKFEYNEKIKNDPEFFLDARVMSHVLINLLDNAVKYSFNAEEPVKFTVESDRDRLNFIISDHGIGIPEKDCCNLFQNFNRASNVGSIPGTGIGLAIVKKFLDIHKGKISIKSVVNHGTTISVSISNKNV